MKDNLTELVVVIDKSGSMSSVQTDAIGGFNTFLKAQQEAVGEANMTVTLFDTNMSFYAANAGVKTVKPLDITTYSPSGCTALYDAVCITVDDIGKKLAGMKEEDRPSKVIFAIITDGAENSSQKFTRKDAFDRITVQRDTYKWEFIFLAAGEDAFKEGESIGMSLSKMAKFVNDKQGIGASYRSVSNYVSACRSVNNAADFVNLTSSFDLQAEVNSNLQNSGTTIKVEPKKTTTTANSK